MNLLVKLTLLLVSMVCLLLLWSSDSFNQNHKFALIDHQLSELPMTFAHRDHAKQQCVACHHNYQDDTGQGLCLECHRSDKQIAFKMRDQFHDLCMGCHLEKHTEGELTGPLRSCRDCHTTDHLP